MIACIVLYLWLRFVQSGEGKTGRFLHSLWYSSHASTHHIDMQTHAAKLIPLTAIKTLVRRQTSATLLRYFIQYWQNLIMQVLFCVLEKTHLTVYVRFLRKPTRTQAHWDKIAFQWGSDQDPKISLQKKRYWVDFSKAQWKLKRRLSQAQTFPCRQENIHVQLNSLDPDG